MSGRGRDQIEEERQSGSEAEEAREGLGDSLPSEEEDDDGEDLINDDMRRDYQAIPELDEYEAEGIDDDQSLGEMNYEQRRKAEEDIDRRRRQQMEDRRIPGQRFPQALREMSEMDEMELDRQFIDVEDRFDEEDTDIVEEERYLNIDECRGKLREWIKEDRTKSWIRKTFKRFINQFKKGEDLTYVHKIREMCKSNKQSLEVVYNDLVNFNSTIALWVAEEPQIILPHLNTVASLQSNKVFPSYRNIHSEIFVRIVQLPVCDLIRELRYKHLDKLIRVEGVITRRSAVFQQMKEITYICQRCGTKKGPFYLENNDSIKPGICITCQANGPFKLDDPNLIYRNFQRITLQESPGKVPAGRVPRQKEVVLLADQIDVARPGDEVEVTGVYTSRYDYALNVKHGFPIYYTIIECNYMRRKQESESTDVDKQMEERIIKLSKDPKVDQKIYNSVAPAIHGQKLVKMALAMAMFGGVSKDIQGKHRIRGDINVLVLGDPGTAKSQFLKNVEKSFYRSVYTTGKGASAVGLTASVRRDYQTNEWMLEGGALVLADRGICLIDEFDKMNEQDRTSIHEAMEQQSISISKAGIVATLQARCSVIAAANPIGGKYDSQMSFHDNVDLTDPILSRFDILCVVKDEIHQQSDESLATFVINSHIKHHPKAAYILNQYNEDAPEIEMIKQSMLDESKTKVEEVIEQDLMKKYILYAREKCSPKMTSIDKDRIIKFYSELRRESEVCGGINIAIRHLESVIRMSEARARIFLRQEVNDDDVSTAISLMLESFISSQKYSVAKQLRKKFAIYLKFKEDQYGLVLNQIDKLYKQQKEFYQSTRGQRDQTIKVPIELLNKELRKLGIFQVEDFFESEMFLKEYQKQNDYILHK